MQAASGWPTSEVPQEMSEMRKRKLAIAVNTIAPYRLPIYAALGEHYDTLLLHGGAEANRAWELNIPAHLQARKVWTWQLRLKKKTGVIGVTDTRHFHVNLGLIWELPRFRPDIIISNELGLRTLISMVYAKLARVPHWVWWGGTMHSERNITGIKKRLRSLMAGMMKHWISYGETSTEYLEFIGVPRTRILQIQNCVPHETFLKEPASTRSWFVGEPRPVLFSVGQLVARKGLDKLIDACGRLVKQGFQFTLALAGNGPDKEKLQEQAAAVQIPSFQLLGNQSQEALNELYRAADVFIFPTLEDVWGLVANEAVWTGIPVLCSKYAGCVPEIIPSENVFDPNDPDSFDAALRKIFTKTLEPSDTQKLLTWQQVAKMILDAIGGKATESDHEKDQRTAIN